MLPPTIGRTFGSHHLRNLLEGTWSKTVENPPDVMKSVMSVLLDCIGHDDVISTIRSVISSTTEISAVGLLALCSQFLPGSSSYGLYFFLYHCLIRNYYN